MLRILSEQVRRFQAGKRARAPRPDVLARFSSERLTGELAAVLDGVCGSQVHQPAN